MSLPFVSVVVPTFNRPDALRGCIGALLGQGYPKDRYEVIVIDDGSTEPHAGRLAEAAAMPGVSFRHQANRGPAAARNHGARIAQGTLLAFTDDDCRPAPTWLPRLAAASATAPTTAFGGLTVNAVDGDVCADATQLLIDYLYGYYEQKPGAFFTSNNLVMPRNAFLALGGFDESMRLAGAEDRELCGRWLRHGHRLTFVGDAVVHHWHPLTLRTFWRQHFTYGRGALHYRRRRARWANDRVRPEPMAFYRDLIAYPLSRRRTVTSAMLLALSQIANATGFLFEATTSTGAKLEERPLMTHHANRTTRWDAPWDGRR
jgi:GT2 family glycosyltransferase